MAKRFNLDVGLLEQPIKIHVCRDRTLSYRNKLQPIFNGVAILVYSVPNVDFARELIRLVGTAQYSEHPQIPGDTWWKLFNGVAGEKQLLEVEDLPEVQAYLHEKAKDLARNYLRLSTDAAAASMGPETTGG